jgi:peptide/nickel transport system permease protein
MDAPTGASSVRGPVVLAVEGLSVDFGRPGHAQRVLDDITITVDEGESVGIVGESGSGKSVLVRALLALLPEDGYAAAGRVLYEGQDLLALDADRLRLLRGTGIAPILPGAREQLNPVVKVGDMMVAVLRAHRRIGRQEARDLAARALTDVGIPDASRRLDAYPHELSGGMAQRVCIALALLHEPRLIIADEPTAGLDVTVTRQVLDLMADLRRERGTSQLMVTRDLAIVAQYCDRVAVLQDGRIVEDRPTREAFEEPHAAYTRRLIEAARSPSPRPVIRGPA